MVMSTSLLETLADELFHIDNVFELVPTMSQFGGVQYLFDCLQQPIGVRQHHAIKFVPLLFVHFAALQRLQVEADRSQWGFQLVSDGMEKAVLFFVASYFPNQEYSVEYQSSNDNAKKYDTQDQRPQLPPVKYDPADVQRHCNCEHTRTQRDNECDRFAAAGNAHRIVSCIRV